MEAIPRIRRPKSVHTLDQVVGQASRLGWTIGITAEDLVGAQCRAVVGLGNAKDPAWQSGKHMVGVWYSSEEDASAHQAAMECVPDGRFEALALSPLSSGRLDPPDIALFYATPGAMIYFINGLQWAGYKRFDWSVVAESGSPHSQGRGAERRTPSSRRSAKTARSCGSAVTGSRAGRGCWSVTATASASTAISISGAGFSTRSTSSSSTCAAMEITRAPIRHVTITRI